MRRSFAAWLVLATAAGAAFSAAGADEARAIVQRAKAEAGSIPAQARSLSLLAWPDEGRPDPQVAALARAELVDFASHGLGALREAMWRVDRIYTADVLTTMMLARRRMTENNPPEYIPALVDAVWLGSSDARRLAIPEVAMHRYGPALMACVDSAIEYPGLQEIVVLSLGEFRDHRARFYLEEVLLQGPAALRPVAAASLTRIGGLAMVPLQGAALSPEPSVRIPAIRALLPASGIDDLTTLYEYLGRFPNDDEVLIEDVRSRAAMLEAALEQRMDFDSATPSSFE
jgi:hypothetical protein